MKQDTQFLADTGALIDSLTQWTIKHSSQVRKCDSHKIGYAIIEIVESIEDEEEKKKMKARAITPLLTNFLKKIFQD